MDELDEITHFIQAEAGDTAEVIMGYGQDERLGEEISVTVIATGFEGNQPKAAYEDERAPQKTYRKLEEDVPTVITPPIEGEEITQPLINPFGDIPVDPDPVRPAAEEMPFLKEVSESDLQDQPIQNDLGLNFIEMNRKPVEEPTQEETPFEEPSLEIEQLEQEPTLEVETEVEVEEKNYFPLFEETTTEEDTVEEVVSEKTIDMEENVLEQRISIEEHRQRTEQRLERIREHGQRLRTPSGLSELEAEPAYKRKNLKLEDVPHSSESNMSRYTLTDKDTEGVTLSKNNPFLDKNVD